MPCLLRPGLVECYWGWTSCLLSLSTPSSYILTHHASSSNVLHSQLQPEISVHILARFLPTVPSQPAPWHILLSLFHLQPKGTRWQVLILCTCDFTYCTNLWWPGGDCKLCLIFCSHDHLPTVTWLKHLTRHIISPCKPHLLALQN